MESYFSGWQWRRNVLIASGDRCSMIIWSVQCERRSSSQKMYFISFWVILKTIQILFNLKSHHIHLSSHFRSLRFITLHYTLSQFISFKFVCWMCCIFVRHISAQIHRREWQYNSNIEIIERLSNVDCWFGFFFSVPFYFSSAIYTYLNFYTLSLRFHYDTRTHIYAHILLARKHTIVGFVCST